MRAALFLPQPFTVSTHTLGLLMHFLPRACHYDGV
jgi:hypothetical protein